MILGLAFPDSGDISLFGKSPEKFGSKDREKIGVVLAGSGMNRYLKAGDMQEMLKAMYSRFDEEYYRGLCGKFCIPLDRPVKDFSTGMKSKMKLVCAVSHGAGFLLLDEPTAGLDVVSRRMVQDLLQAAHGRGRREEYLDQVPILRQTWKGSVMTSMFFMKEILSFMRVWIPC